MVELDSVQNRYLGLAFVTLPPPPLHPTATPHHTAAHLSGYHYHHLLTLYLLSLFKLSRCSCNLHILDERIFQVTKPLAASCTCIVGTGQEQKTVFLCNFFRNIPHLFHLSLFKSSHSYNLRYIHKIVNSLCNTKFYQKQSPHYLYHTFQQLLFKLLIYPWC